MTAHVHRSVDRPIRTGLSTTELWTGPDKGIILCWEKGRQKQDQEPELAARARAGELVTLVWKRGTLQYLAYWQGLRGEALDVSLLEQMEMTCSKTGKKFVFDSSPKVNP